MEHSGRGVNFASKTKANLTWVLRHYLLVLEGGDGVQGAAAPLDVHARVVSREPVLRAMWTEECIHSFGCGVGASLAHPTQTGLAHEDVY